MLDPLLEPELLPLELGLLGVVPELPVESELPLGLGVVLGVVLGEVEPGLPLLRGSVSPRRPCGEVLSVLPGVWLVLFLLPTSLPLFLQAPTPTISAAADARAMNVRIMVLLSW